MDFRLTYDPGPLARRCANADDVVGEELATAVTRTRLEGQRRAQQKVRVKTGTLRRSIAGRTRRLGLRVEGEWGTNVPYAKYVEEGRGPVVATRARALRFTIGGRVLFRASVGPAAARPFLRPSLAEVKPLFRREVQAAVRRASRRILGGR